VIELYAITHDPAPPLPDVAPLTAVASDGLAAVCAPAGDNELSAKSLWRHEEVVEALMEDRDLLPVRYGTRLAGEATVARALAERHDELTRALERVRGAVELSLRALAAGGAAEAGETDLHESGAVYLQARARATAAEEAAARAVHQPLSALARASSRRPARAPELLRAAYLVSRSEVSAFADAVRTLQDENPDLRLLCTGPWPPYSFAQP